MSDPAQREWRFYLGDMIGFAEKVIAYTDGLDQAGFIASGLNYDATLRNLELIGEATTRGACGQSADSVAARHRHPQPADPRVSRHRQRHPVEHHPQRYSRLVPSLARAQNQIGMTKQQKLELLWIGKVSRTRLEPCLGRPGLLILSRGKMTEPTSICPNCKPSVEETG